VHTEMKSLSERNPLVVGAIGLAVTGGLVLGATQYDKLPFFSSGTTYQAYFAEAGGLVAGAEVQVAGYRVGQVSSVTLDGPRVLVAFTVDDHIGVGDRSEAAIKTKTLLGSKALLVSPRGDGHQQGPIPLQRTTAPYQLPDALGDLAATISGLNTDQLSASLMTVSDTLRDAPPQLRAAAQGVARFSDTLDARDSALRNLLANAKKVSSVLGERSQQIAGLVADTNALLAALLTESGALNHILDNLTGLAQQLSGLSADNRQQLKPALTKLNETLTIIDDRKDALKKAIPMLARYAMSLGEAVGSGPYFKAYIANLIPGQFLQPFVDAAFSDLGLDPHVLLPSQRTDPPTGRRGTPPLPIPYPRTGQGGEPRRTLPDAITGKPGDPRYPYREPLPAPPPGGPPPGPPAVDHTPVYPGQPPPMPIEVTQTPPGPPPAPLRPVAPR
jgi:phospholipid/cholesterol/gamma-HCH transport system substrate-binding protein